MVPTISIGSEEKNAGELSPNTLAEATQLFSANGTLILKNILEPELVNAMHDAFMDRYREYLVDNEHEHSLTVGDKRFMVTSTLEPPFSDPAVYASPFVAPVLSAFLTPNYILSSFGAVVSLPGAEAQHVHLDFPGLYPDSSLDKMLPPFAITMIIPLIDIDKLVGTTLVWPKSHRMDVQKIPHTLEPEWPILSRGDCLLMDYRLLHGGSANESDRARPILYNVYSRPWFRDHMNYSRQKRLDISSENFLQVPKEHRHIFSHVRYD